MLNVDKKNKDILREMYKADRPLTTFKISTKLEISPVTAKKRLNTLCSMNIVKNKKLGKLRIYNRNGKRLKVPSKILWDLDLKK